MLEDQLQTFLKEKNHLESWTGRMRSQVPSFGKAQASEATQRNHLKAPADSLQLTLPL